MQDRISRVPIYYKKRLPYQKEIKKRVTSASLWHESFLLSLPFDLQLIRTSITQKKHLCTAQQDTQEIQTSVHPTVSGQDLARGWEAREVVTGPAEGQQDLSSREGRGLPSLCSWRNPLFWGETTVTGGRDTKGKMVKKTEGKCILLSALKFWQDIWTHGPLSNPPPLLPQLQDHPTGLWAPSKPQVLSTHLFPLCCHSFFSASFFYAQAPNLSQESVVVRKNKNLCYIASPRKQNTPNYQPTKLLGSK